MAGAGVARGGGPGPERRAEPLSFTVLTLLSTQKCVQRTVPSVNRALVPLCIS